MRQFLAIDIGGTMIKYGIVTEHPKVLCSFEKDTEASRGGSHIIDQIKSIYHEMKETYSFEGIGISSAGQIDQKNGKVHYATDAIPKYSGMPVKRLIEDYTGLYVSVMNDVNAMALAEYHLGDYNQDDVILCLTLGTGIGGAIIENGAVFTGFNGGAGEIGHIKVEKNGLPCSCGKRGCYESYASTLALTKKVKRENIPGIQNGKQFFNALKEKPTEKLEKIYEEWVEDIAYGLSMIIPVLNPNKIVIGGGVSHQGAFLIDPIKEKLQQFSMPSLLADLEIQTATISNQSGMVGAVLNLRNEINKIEYHGNL